jgi:hypothetical protein
MMDRRNELETEAAVSGLRSSAPVIAQSMQQNRLLEKKQLAPLARMPSK